MTDIKLAKYSDIKNLRRIWQLCFGDDESYINFYYQNKFNPDQTIMLYKDGIIAAMLTMLPLSISIPSYGVFDSSMLYAIAAHPDFQGKGLASQLINHCNDLLNEEKVSMSVLVPANKSLFGFYYKLGYADGFYIRESILSKTRIDSFKDVRINPRAFIPIEADEYNAIRNNILKDRIYIKYNNEDIIYQKKLSKAANSDIYKIEFENIIGCAVIERLSEDKIFVKEILLADNYLQDALKCIANLFSANEYIVRTSSDKGESIGGIVRPFAVYKPLNDMPDISHDKTAYLALAFD